MSAPEKSSPDDATSGGRDVVSVERVIPAAAAAIFALLSDPGRHREIDGSGTVRDAISSAGSTGTAQQPLRLGSVFGMGMKLGIPYRMNNTVVEFEQDRLIAWQPRPDTLLMRPFLGGRIWRYELEPTDGGTLVRESWDIRQEQVKLLVRPYASRVKPSMVTTLERLERVLAG
jgi:hypothetical protein